MRSLLLLPAVGVAACGGKPSAPARTELPIVDSHVHLSLEPVDAQLAAAGVLYAVDLAAPDRDLDRPTALRGIIRSGAMLTHVGGYPLDAWGSDGYGFGCDDAACVTARIDFLAAHHVPVLKIALDDDGLAPALVPAAVSAAHAHGMKVAVHALSAASAKLAGEAGADILAHTPLEPLPAATVQLFAHRAVITTLAAFGGSRAAVDNLRALRAAGATVVYGTDLGNLHDAGPSAQEMALMRQAGMDDAAITGAMTAVPLRYWGFAR